jgi:hypothetical protein
MGVYPPGQPRATLATPRSQRRSREGAPPLRVSSPLPRRSWPQGHHDLFEVRVFGIVDGPVVMPYIRWWAVAKSVSVSGFFG